ncbi:hypothetical protein H8B09_26970 [Paenibacillus sp. PR3]|uniref:Uncharacterized protein n=1 Tax=Paenibacillus terricola TaxID=2763503 RepID=A0ABR8N6G6_9BACL|nr:hypothetical protein [Paenibacillus terricola]MBD3922424.1 hypothetical protein [Paenibacillus terricola]
MPENGLQVYERNHYFYGKLLTVRDFETEQSYFNEKRHMLNRLLHGTGIICGLQAERSGLRGISVAPGVAIDGDGQEIVAAKEQLRTDIREMDGYPEGGGAKTLYLMLHYDERTIETVPALGGATSCDGGCEANRVQEGLRLSWTTEAPEPELALPKVLYETTVLYEEGKVRVERIVPRWVSPGDAFEVTIRATALQNMGEDYVEFIVTEHLGDHLTLLQSELMSLVLGGASKGTVQERKYYVKASADGTDGAGTGISGTLGVLDGGSHQQVETPVSAIVFGAYGALNERVQEYFAETTDSTWGTSGGGVPLAAVTIDANDEIESVIGNVRRYVYNNPLLQRLLREEEKTGSKLLPHALSHSASGHDPLNVTDLQGLLADPQWVVVYSQGDEYVQARRFSFSGPGVTVQKSPYMDDHVLVDVQTAPHAALHGSEGVDPIDVTNLPGVLAEPQKVAVSSGGGVAAQGGVKELAFGGSGVVVKTVDGKAQITVTDTQKVAVSLAGAALGSVEELAFGGNGVAVQTANGKAQITVTDTRGVQVFNGTDYANANKLRFIGQGIKVLREGEQTDVMIPSSSGTGSEVVTGTILFTEVRGGEKRNSHWITDVGGNPMISFGVDIVAGDIASVGVAGEFALGLTDAPEVAAIYKPYGSGFSILLKDRREKNALPVDWRIRWWAAPNSKDYGEQKADPGFAWFKELIIARLIVAPGQYLLSLASVFGEDYSWVGEVLRELEEEKRIIMKEDGTYYINPNLMER